MFLSIAFFDFFRWGKVPFAPCPTLRDSLARRGGSAHTPRVHHPETLGNVATWPACQPITQTAAQEAHADPPHRSRTRHPPRLRPMQTAADAPRPDQQTATQTASNRRRTETPRRPCQAPTWANCTPRQQTRTERPETRRNEKRNAHIMKKRRKTVESRNFRKKNKFSSIFIEKTLDNNINSCYHVIEINEHTTPTHRRRPTP